MLTLDLAPRTAGPDWLRSRREDAAHRLAGAALPSFEEEVWRYSRIDDLDLSRFTLVAETASTPPHPRSADAAAVVTCVDGVPVHIDVDPAWAARGLTVTRWSDHPDPLPAVMAEPVDVFADLNLAHAHDGVLVATRPGLAVDTPVILVHRYTTPGAACLPRLLVRAGADSAVSVIEEHLPCDHEALVVAVTELDVASAARVQYTNLQQHGRRVWQLATLVANVAQQATLDVAAAGFGGEYARLRTDCRLSGRGATGNLLAAYFGDDTQVLDFRTFQEHEAPDTTSDLLFKGALTGQSRSVYTGLIRVGKHARGTNAFQTNRNIKLSEDAWAESVPNLEIENNDVHCSHASTVGPVDPDQRFYLESRGVPTAVAEQLIVAGFFEEVARRMPHASSAQWIRAAIAAKLEG